MTRHIPNPHEVALEREVHPRKALSAMLRIIGIGMMVIGPLTGLGLAFVNPLLGMIVWAGISAGAMALFRRAKRLKAVGVAEKLAKDPRPPVLYLRSFTADERAAENVGQVLSIKGVEQVEMVTRCIGPMVAIGRPTENLPMIGAARMYVADDQWQGRVKDLMERSQLVLMRAGKTEGFWWEVEHAIKLVRPERLIWLVPFSKDNYRLFAERANHWLPKPIPTDAGEMAREVGSLKSWIWFEPDWTPHLEKPGMRDDASHGLPVAALVHQALAPTLRRLGHTKFAMRCAGGKRMLAFLVDMGVAWATVLALSALAQLLNADWPTVVAVLAIFAYLLLMDLPQVGGSLGKRVTKLRIVTEDGLQPSIGQAMARNLVKVVTIPVALLYAPVSMGWSVQRMLPQDLITRTYVVAPNAA
jgi:uncharacterized RDD family membrane protein YckC